MLPKVQHQWPASDLHLDLPYLAPGRRALRSIFSQLARFVPGVLNLVIALTGAFLLWRKRISHVCQLLFDLLSYLFPSLSARRSW